MSKQASSRFCKCLTAENLTRGAHRSLYLRDRLWESGKVLGIAFLDGTVEQHALVQCVAKKWLKYCNLQFAWNVSAPEAEIRISFDSENGSWSYVGTDALHVKDKTKATMNFGWLDKGTVLHEFGHMLGLAHEHQNPRGGLTWNREVVLKDLSGPPNNWDVEKIEQNVLNHYSADNENVVASEFDPDGIMLYFFPAEWNEQGIQTKSNKKLSATDKSTISEMYPFEDSQWEIKLDGGDESDDCGVTSDSADDQNVSKGCFGNCGVSLRTLRAAFRK